MAAPDAFNQLNFISTKSFKVKQINHGIAFPLKNLYSVLKEEYLYIQTSLLYNDMLSESYYHVGRTVFDWVILFINVSSESAYGVSILSYEYDSLMVI